MCTCTGACTAVILSEAAASQLAAAACSLHMSIEKLFSPSLQLAAGEDHVAV